MICRLCIKCKSQAQPSNYNIPREEFMLTLKKKKYFGGRWVESKEKIFFRDEGTTGNNTTGNFCKNSVTHCLESTLQSTTQTQ